MARVLIAGGDSVIGAALARRLEAQGHPVLATTRRPERAGAGRPLLDLADPPDRWPNLEADVAVVCVAESKIAACEADPVETRRVNVERAGELVSRLAGAGAFVLLPSTTMVFDGAGTSYAPADPVSPQTEYGRQKADLERIVAEAAPGAHAVVRIGKVVARAVALFGGWLDCLRAGGSIAAFTDAVMAPVSADGVAELFERIALARACGIFHYTASAELSYFEAGCTLARALGAPESLVRPQRRPSPAPDHAMLDSRETAARLRVTIPHPRDAMLALALEPPISAT